MKKKEKIRLGDSVKGEKDLKNYQIRTDLVVDILNNLKTDENIILEKRKGKDIEVLDITIKNDNNSLNKKHGKYITISFKDLTDKENKNNLESVLTKEIKNILEYLKIDFNKKCLIVGLGNSKSTPDALGPKVIESILVTRYLYEIEKIQVDPNYRNVSAFTPGVTGNTGIESSDIILGIVDNIKPDFIIVVDALASSSIERVNKTIQITDSGIHPGSGVYNNRKELSYETLKIPVISIGVPTVIEAFVLVSDTIKYLLKNISYNKENINNSKNKLIPDHLRNYINQEDNLTIEEKKKVLGEVGTLNEEEIKKLIFEVLTPIGYNMMVTPKEVDFIIDKTSEVLANSINKALHKNFDI